MKPAGFARIRKRLKLSQVKLAAELNVERQTVWRWETGAVAIPKVAELAVKYLVLRNNETKTQRKRPATVRRTRRRA